MLVRQDLIVAGRIRLNLQRLRSTWVGLRCLWGLLSHGRSWPLLSCLQGLSSLPLRCSLLSQGVCWPLQR